MIEVNIKTRDSKIMEFTVDKKGNPHAARMYCPGYGELPVKANATMLKHVLKNALAIWVRRLNTTSK